MVPSQMKKAELQTWLMDRGIQWEEQWLRARLMKEVERYRDKNPMVEIVAEEKGHKVLFLPDNLYHRFLITISLNLLQQTCSKPLLFPLYPSIHKPCLQICLFHLAWHH